ncbi:dsDNA nuclease domain-containing protein [Clostridium lundense]|uniref:dsDNA nuclease domain-containing protein n=1 Tax=Clostridium lundense TaxID=319475 RepID=UPI000489C42E|nr:SAVED domain-containing protein [Clostridium lundense]
MKTKNNYFEIIKLQMQKYISKTSAEATLKGFLYQFFLTIDEWLKIHLENKDYKIYPEKDDDIKIENKENLYYIQAKAYSKRFTLNETAFIKAIYHFYILYVENNAKRLVRFTLDTNSQPGPKSNELRNWANNNLKNKDKENIYKTIKKNLEESIDFTNDFTNEQKNLLKQELSKNWYEFIDLINLNFRYKSVDESINAFKASILSNIKILNDHSSEHVILDRLLVEVFQRSIEEQQDDKKIDKNLLESILESGDENNIMVINEMINKTDEIISKINEIHTIIKDNVKPVEDKKEILENIMVRSREKIEDSLLNLSLSEFFIENSYEPSNNYREIKSQSYWNNELLDKIDKFFISLTEKYNTNITINLDKTHTSIAFYIGYWHLKRFSDTMYYKKNNDIYYEQEYGYVGKSWIWEEVLINNGDSVTIIVTSTMKPNHIKNCVKNFIKKDNLCTNKLVTFYLENKQQAEVCSNYSITKENIGILKNELGKLISEECLCKKINLFLSCPNELAYLLGRNLDKYENITLYEVKDYGSSDCNYVKTIDIKQRKNKFKSMR